MRPIASRMRLVAALRALDVVGRATRLATEAVRGGQLFDERIELLASLRAGFGVAGSVSIIDHLLQLGDALLVVSPSSFVDDELVGARFETEARVERSLGRPDPRLALAWRTRSRACSSRRGEASRPALLRGGQMLVGALAVAGLAFVGTGFFRILT